jgi:hypothetical protein
VLKMVYTSFKPSVGVQLMFAGKLTKAEKKEMFFEPCLSCFLLSLASPFAAKIVRFLRLIRSLHNVKFIPSLSGF